MELPALFISDLHLDPQKPELTQSIVHFLQTRATAARVLFILGDLFEVWLGDDDDKHGLQPVLDALKQYSKQRNLYIMHGNRDFLMGEQLMAELGAEILPDPWVLDWQNKKIVLTHGDLLCTDDVAYQAFRKTARNPHWQAEFLAKPLPQRRAVARQMRQDSQQAMQGKSMEIMDVNPQTVMQMITQYQASYLIHGHTHRPGVQQLDQTRQRWVLGDWTPQPSFIFLNQDSIELVDPRVSTMTNCSNNRVN